MTYYTKAKTVRPFDFVRLRGTKIVRCKNSKTCCGVYVPTCEVSILGLDGKRHIINLPEGIRKNGPLVIRDIAEYKFEELW